MILHKISTSFTGLLCFSSKVCILNQLQLQRSPCQKIKGLLIVLECLQACQMSHASNFSYFNVLNQSHLVLSKHEIHQLLPYIFKRQPQKAHQLSLLLQAALVQINEGLYFRSPRLATRFESNAAKVLVKALLNLILKFNIQEIQVVKNSEDHISSVFSLKINRQNIKNAFG